MKQKVVFASPFLLLLILAAAVVGLLAAKGLIGPVVTPTPTTWSPPVLRGQPLHPTPSPTSGWWNTPPAWLTPIPSPGGP